MADRYVRGKVNIVTDYLTGKTSELYIPMSEQVKDGLFNLMSPQFGTGVGIVVRAGEDLKAGQKVYQQEGTTLMYAKGGEKRHELGYTGTDVKKDTLFVPVTEWQIKRKG